MTLLSSKMGSRQLSSHKSKLQRMARLKTCQSYLPTCQALRNKCKLQRKLAEKEDEMTNLATHVANQELEKTTEVSFSNTIITPQDIKELAPGIKEYQAAMNPIALGYKNPYLSHYDSVPFHNGYQKPNLETFDGRNRSSHEHLAHFYSVCGETVSVSYTHLTLPTKRIV